MIHPADLIALWLTVKLALVSTAILLVVGTPLGWWLATTRRRVRPVLEAAVALPLVLPPTVLGFYLLLLLGAQGPMGRLLTLLGGRPLAFTFAGLVIGSVIYSLPFVVQPIRDAFLGIGRQPLEAAATLGAGPHDRFWRVALP
jgi:molybdate transport system permease protein